MKGIKLLFAVMLAPLAFQAAFADDASDIARAATRRGTTTTISTNRQKNTPATKSGDTRTTASRNTDNAKTGASVRERTQSDPSTTPRTTTNTSVTPRSTTVSGTKSISSRTGTTIIPRNTPLSRMALSPTRTTTSITKSENKTSSRPNHARGATITRSADTPTTASAIMSRNFSQCRDVFYSCMDEFCANKDTQLRRCACSARASEFNATKKNLAQIEDKLLDFSERLLTVNMDAEDAIAMNQATAGELAFNSEDKSTSKKMLDEIAKKLNASFDDSNFDQNLNAINLSLNTNAAFDSVDSLMGASTTVKSGTALYSAALPTCREMAAEVCSNEELAIAESGYQMTIEQDCNTVAKSYQTQTDMARTKVFESSALLDMSRLDIHQQRNSDDILTCKKKMLNMLTDNSVCGTELGKCLDISGRYIDPTTGEAFLTENLADLGTLITRPSGDETWTTVPSNAQFVSFLNSKKIFLEPAMEKCQDISTYVWDAFIEDALAQIKLAQNAKLEDMRQSCTTLTTQCLDNANDSISDFDARALSIFGVAADATAQAMCSDVMTACTALMDAMDNIITDDKVSDWESGITGIATTDTYEKIITTCRQVGQNCIIQACTSITGNFGLCENIDTSINRKSIISRRACWDEVVQCVADAGTDSLNRIMAQQNRTPTTKDGDKYSELYGKKTGVFNICQKCGTDNEPDCATCRLAEEIWGNCEKDPATKLGIDDTNKILVNKDNQNETLMSWFARNTGTKDAPDSCRDTTCPRGEEYTNSNSTCVPQSMITSDGTYCNADNKADKFTVYGKFTNCCTTNTYDWRGNCCEDNNRTGINTGEHYFAQDGLPDSNLSMDGDTSGTGTCGNGTTQTLIASYKDNDNIIHNIICTGTVTWSSTNPTTDYPNGKTIQCSGEIIDIRSDGIYTSPNTNYVTTYYNETNSTKTEWSEGTKYQAEHSFIKYNQQTATTSEPTE